MQIVYRLIRLIPKVNVKEATAISYPVRPSNWKHQALFKKKVDRDLNASFLNYTKKLSLPNDWNNEIPSKLWVYNLHYFEYLLSDNKDNEEHIYISSLNRWIDENKISPLSAIKCSQFRKTGMSGLKISLISTSFLLK